jgi:hypothetical protein
MVPNEPDDPPPADASPPTEEPREPREPPHDDNANIPESVRQRLETFVPELVKRAFTAGLGAVFTTEEGIRRMTKEITLPKEVAGYLVNTAASTKDELMRVMAREVREFLQNVNLSEEIAKMLTTLSFEVKTEVRFIPNSEKYGGVEPDVKASVRVKRGESHLRRPRFRRKRDDAE